MRILKVAQQIEKYLDVTELLNLHNVLNVYKDIFLFYFKIEYH